MSSAAIGLGSNVGDRMGMLRNAVAFLRNSGLEIVETSDIFETPPWGVEDQPLFLNACILVRTVLSPGDLLLLLKKGERVLGRKPGRRWGPREIDLDILFYDDISLLSEELSIPHRDMERRPFVLVPLAQIAPGWVHPDSGRTVAQMAAVFLPEKPAQLLRICRL